LPIITYRPERFGTYWGSAFIQPTILEFGWEELAKAAVTVGRRGWADVFQYAQFSAFEMTWRLGLVWANLLEDGGGWVRPSEALRGLDPSEKGAVSYFMGCCFTKLLFEKLCGVSWLLHYDLYSVSLNGSLASSERPDFVGLDVNQQWIVSEAKGRTGNSISDDIMQRAKRQTRSLRNLNGQLPVLRAAIGVSLSKRVAVRVWDPEGYNDDAVDVSIDVDTLMRRYYEALIGRTGLLRVASIPSGPARLPRRSILMPGSDARLIIDDDIVTAYQSEDPIWQKVMTPKARTEASILREIVVLRESLEHAEETEASNRLRQLINVRRRSNIGQAADGVTVQLGPSWATANMQLEPQRRTH
jgi:hypothetical protein